MTRIRLAIFSTTILIVGVVGWLFFLFARGYRIDPEKLKFLPNGLLVIKSDPDGAQVIIDGELKIATNATIPLLPGTYDITLKKEGFMDWNKRLTIEKEIVTETTAHLFKVAPSLSATTFNGAFNPVPSNDMTKIAYAVPPRKNDDTHNEENMGLWVMETVDLPLGFAKNPKRITDGDLTNAVWEWSVNDREILLTTEKGSYLLDAGRFTPQNERVNLADTVDKLHNKWERDKKQKLTSKIRSLPDELKDILSRKTHTFVFSPDEDMILYIASSSATLPPELIKPVPGSSTQKENRNIKVDHTYIYNIKEDRNFLIDSNASNLTVGDWKPIAASRRISWFPTSRHLVFAEKEKITIMDYDGTNRQKVYAGIYETPHAFPTLSTGRILILTNLGANTSFPNLYSLSVK